MCGPEVGQDGDGGVPADAAVRGRQGARLRGDHADHPQAGREQRLMRAPAFCTHFTMYIPGRVDGTRYMPAVTRNARMGAPALVVNNILSYPIG